MKTEHILSAMIFLLSCSPGNKPDKYSDYVLHKNSNDTVTSVMMKTKDFSNSIFLNDITLKDGQRQSAGLSFIMEMDSFTFVVSAKHLLGQDGGFTDSIKLDKIAEILGSWSLKNLSETINFSINSSDIIQADGDVLMFKEKNNPSNSQLKSFKLAKDYPFTTVNGTIDIKNSPTTYFVVGYTKLGKEALYEVRLAGEYEKNGFIFKKVDKFDFHGLSGAPIINKKGNVLAILSAGLNYNGEELLVGTKIRPLNL